MTRVHAELPSKRFDEDRAPAEAPFRDPDLPLATRVADLLARLTLDEKIALLHQEQPAVPRLGLAAFSTGTEVLHGMAWLGVATVFPQAIGLASSWDPELLGRVATAVSDEVRAAAERTEAPSGLNVWAPVVDLLRDPRAGRNEEGYAEDPLLTGVLSTAYARGLRGDHPRYLKTAPTLKHFFAYNHEANRDTASSGVRPRLLREYYLRAFSPAVRAGAAAGVMLSYNLVNGRPNHLSPYVAELLDWAPEDLLIVSDANGPSNIAGSQGYYPTQPEGHAAALRAGLDTFTDQDPTFTLANLHAGLDRGLLTEADIDRAAGALLRLRFRLGELDPAEGNPYRGIRPDVIDCAGHRALAAEAVRRSIVLLKNDGLLPLSGRALHRIAVLGPLADTLNQDWYSGGLPYAITPADGIRAALAGGTAVVHEGLDQIALRVRTTGHYVTAVPGAAGAPLSARPSHGAAPEPAQLFDLMDWGTRNPDGAGRGGAVGVWSLRSHANRRIITVRPEPDQVLVDDQTQPNGWVVQETFSPVPAGDGEGDGDGGMLLAHLGTGRYVTVRADGTLSVTADPTDATTFDLLTIFDGAAAAAAVAAEADLAVVVLGNHPMVNGRETEDRHNLDLPPGQDRLLRAVRAANPRTVLVLETGYPVELNWAQANVPAILWSSHGGQ